MGKNVVVMVSNYKNVGKQKGRKTKMSFCQKVCKNIVGTKMPQDNNVESLRQK